MMIEVEQKKNDLILELIRRLESEEKCPVISLDLLKDDMVANVLLDDKDEEDTELFKDFSNKVSDNVSDLLYDENRHIVNNFNTYWTEFLNSNNSNTIFGNEYVIAQKKVFHTGEKDIKYVLVLINSTRMITDTSKEIADSISNLLSENSKKFEDLFSKAKDKEYVSHKFTEYMDSVKRYLSTGDESCISSELKDMLNSPQFKYLQESGILGQILESKKMQKVLEDIDINGVDIDKLFNDKGFVNAVNILFNKEDKE